MKTTLNISGTAGKLYDLEKLSTENTRTDSKTELVVQVWYWNPNGVNAYKDDAAAFEAHKKPNPPNLTVGQMWVSKLVATDFNVRG